MTGPEDTADLPGGAEAMAAEYVLGLLSEDEARRFEAQMAQDPDLRQDVAAWSTYFTTLTDDIAPVDPAPQVFRRIEGALFGQKRPPLWRQLMPYLGGAVAAGLLAWAVLQTDMLQPEAPHLYADLVAEDQGYTLLAHWAPDSQTFMLRRDAGVFPQDSALEIWLIPGPSAAPISVGLMQPDTLTQIPVPDELVARMSPGATVAISREPPGGSPTGAPTGPVLAVGSLGVRG
ncbi:anti-sigma factor domain-containing protein [Aestuariicoccus sp. MJ-SS9]|uniref:anti-sigma factor n=1 Tax=Aestuariicoccus sp. MJ-SS9 TaxID=3079855 RepID=UPI00290697B7|nr:anti-sigma factor [Aestuariicoccus sp. MJ-SS9]MDU8911141.1 anti-sigma factor [Aestuariicoccus sp. MJ-SS9]